MSQSGNVLCHHGRVIACLECAGELLDEAAEALSTPVEPTPEPETCEWRQTVDGAWTNGCASASKPQGFYQSVNNLWSHCHFCGGALRLVPSEEPK